MRATSACAPRTSTSRCGCSCRPTFYEEGGELLVESHLIGFDGDLYGEGASVRFTDVVRLGQIKFESMDALAEQMQRDLARARELLGA